MTPEGKLKAACRDLARKHGLVFVNVESKGINGWPDTECGKYPKGSGILHYEFKRLGQVPSEQQFKRMQEINDAGGDAQWGDTVDKWKRAVGL